MLSIIRGSTVLHQAGVSVLAYLVVITALLAIVIANLFELLIIIDASAKTIAELLQGGGEFRKVRGFEDTAETVVFHTGTAFSVGRLVTSCGRVLGVTSLGTTIEESINKAYRVVDSVSEQCLIYRTDIGEKALSRFGS